MKKFMLLVTGALLCASFSVVSANNASPTKKRNVEIIDNYHAVSLQDVIVKHNFDLSNNVAILENQYISFEQLKCFTVYKMGKLKNKVNIIHMFYRVKI